MEVCQNACAVVFPDNINDSVGQVVQQGQADTFLHMRGNDEHAHAGRKVVVRIGLETHVFGKKLGLVQFADIVKIGTDSGD